MLFGWSSAPRPVSPGAAKQASLNMTVVRKQRSVPACHGQVPSKSLFPWRFRGIKGIGSLLIISRCEKPPECRMSQKVAIGVLSGEQILNLTAELCILRAHFCEIGFTNGICQSSGLQEDLANKLVSTSIHGLSFAIGSRWLQQSPVLPAGCRMLWETVVGSFIFKRRKRPAGAARHCFALFRYKVNTSSGSL